MGRPWRLAGKLALVTGAGQGIGRGCAQMFARQGAHVLAVDLDGQALAETLAGVTLGPDDGPGRIEAIAPTNMLDEAAVNALFDDIGARFGKLDILLNAAAFAHFAWIEDMAYDQWKQTLAGELDIVFLACKAAWPWLSASGQSAIINFASANAYHALDGSPALAHCAGKGGVLAMTRQLAMEGAPNGIRANTISPGFILTAATTAHLARDPAFKDKVLAKNMIKRLGRPEDIAYLATFLGSDESAYVTASDIACDGGAVAW